MQGPVQGRDKVHGPARVPALVLVPVPGPGQESSGLLVAAHGIETAALTVSAVEWYTEPSPPTHRLAPATMPARMSALKPAEGQHH